LKGEIPMPEENRNDEIHENLDYKTQTDDDEISDDLQGNEFLFPPINPHYRNDLE
jgi:hypothetical protein